MKKSKTETRGRKPTGRTEVLYVRVTKANRSWLRARTNKLRESESEFVDEWLTNMREIDARK